MPGGNGGGGQGRTRTADAGLFRAALYHLSYLAVGFHLQSNKTGPRMQPAPLPRTLFAGGRTRKATGGKFRSARHRRRRAFGPGRSGPRPVEERSQCRRIRLAIRRKLLCCAARVVPSGCARALARSADWASPATPAAAVRDSREGASRSMVRTGRVELPWVAPLDPKSSASASSATSAAGAQSENSRARGAPSQPALAASDADWLRYNGAGEPQAHGTVARTSANCASAPGAAR